MSVCARVHVQYVCMFPTLGIGEEDEAPYTSNAADDQAHGQHGTVRHLPAQPAHKKEAQDDLHPAQAVHQTVPQLTKAEVTLRQGSHHGLRVSERCSQGQLGEGV